MQGWRARRTGSRWVAVAALAAGVLLVPGAQGAGAEEGEDGMGGPAAPAEYSYLQKAVPGGTLPAHAYEDAAAEAAGLTRTAGTWESLGPSNIGGRVVDLALDAERSDTVYVAAASGGLWRSTNAGSTFEKAWPDGQTQAMGAVASAADGTVYAGTGEVNPGGGSVTYEGTGVYRSVDRGKTWKSVGLRDSATIGAIRTDPRNPRHVLVAAAGSLYTDGGDRGVYETRNAGKTWHRILRVPNGSTGAVDVQFDPSNPRRVYAVLWDRRREPDKRTYGGVGSGVYRSDDGGVKWTRLDGGLPGPGSDVGRIGLGISASEPGRLYAVWGNASGGFGGFLTSKDAGDSWTELPRNEDLEESQGGFQWWFGKVWVDPDDARHVHVAGVELMTTKDGGGTWTGEGSAIHADQHAMAWDPRRSGRVYLGNDGGLYRSEADGDGAWSKGTQQPWTQLYTVATTPQDTSRISGGAQDNGSLRSWGGVTYNSYVGGDGLQNLINPTDRDNVFACYQYGNCFRSTNGGNANKYFTSATVSDRRNWLTPLQFDPRDPKVLYYGGNRLNRSTDGGITWQVISPDLTGGPSRDTYPYGTLSTVAAATDGRTVWVGTDDGRVWVTRDLGAHWTKVLEGQPWVTRIAVDPVDPATAYVTLSGYRSGSAQPHVLRTRDAGATWNDLSGNLPQAPVNDVVLAEGGRLYAATDQGVFTSRPGSAAHWYRVGDGLPLVPVDDIEYDAVNQRLVAATFGRGFYAIRTPE
ncbi:glycosyl hydrolase [Streptomyces sp. NPDC051020]|uniref:WD40/YVTN/BNR-like repeat-containing protein n=1 Tax=Streptomyces sp. NPDC051020 TaxID=3155409 RepID=UPI00342036FC